MPDATPHHPRRTLSEENAFTPNPRAPFVELGLVTCFSFLRGASDAVDLVTTAHALGYDALGVADRNTLAGVVRVHVEARVAKLRPVIGCRLVLLSGEEFLAYPKDREAYGRLSRLLSKGKMQDAQGGWQRKGACDLTLDDLATHAEGIALVLVPSADLEGLPQRLHALARRLPGLGHVAASWLYRGNDRARINALARMAAAERLSILATNDVLYHAPHRRPLQDVMTCIREGVRLDEAGFLLQPNAERHLKGPDEMVRLFGEWPEAIAAARTLADACTFSLEDLRYEYPHEIVPEGATAQEHLERLTWEGAARRYPAGVPPKVKALIEGELALIARHRIARYFLTIHEIVAFARDRGILCQGRGSAANSAVCFVLGITAVDPAAHELLIERFISDARMGEPPDIDVDFEHERREEVIQHIYAKYGRHRAGLCATVIHYRPRSAIREVGKVLGLSEDVTGALAKTVWGSWGTEIAERHVREAGLDLADRTLRMAVRLASELIGMPRHLGQHVGGFVLTERPLTETVPVGHGAMPERSFIEWDKDDIDALGIMKVDILALGMLTCLRKALDLVAAHHGRSLDLATIPQEDPATYAMLGRADSIGVFQVESRAQMNMLPRLRPATFYDLVIEVAIVRPGPIQGDMVHPYLRRRSGQEAVAYPAPAPPAPPDELKRILGRTLGVPIFQEQAMKIAMTAAMFDAREANELRKAMATFRSRGQIDRLEAKMVNRMIARGYDPDFARRCFDQIKGFGEYGFPESHAASFALLVYASAWLKCHYPAAFGAALLNSQPMGFYAPAQIVRDMREHGVAVRPPDVNHSDWDTTLVPDGRSGMAVRLGLRTIAGLPAAAAARLLAARDEPYAALADLQRRAGLAAAQVRRLAEADAFVSLGLDRRQALWEAKALRDAPDLPLFRGEEEQGREPAIALPPMRLPEQVVADYQTLRLSLKAHPMAFLRQSLRAQGYVCAADLAQARDRQLVRLAGLVLIRQRPGSAGGVCFITLEDETGSANLVVWPAVLEAHRKVVMQAHLLMVEGHVQREAEIVHLVARSLLDRTDALLRLAPDGLAPPLSRADEVVRPVQGSIRSPQPGHPRNARVMPRSQDFR
ncbi:error-prone DNA polymerase [Rubellimicrobium sp. CFH 75288]|uniref:error-prone DNA polymerase n=1 Tax=Rubellimicrobium sp. CFH 75288 TaxID=2697034 RepID=UPI00141324B4|nr:error-prone DNA polymerase [Rubellimicrobium sp. CFH 75288]NAZ38361.1 DNA polymerase III subunit alpha [Rubellimicrobium sp. CFH 75288]